MTLTPTLRTLEHPGWTTKPPEDTEANRLTAAEVDGNFLYQQSLSMPIHRVAGKYYGGSPGDLASQAAAINNAAAAAEAEGGGVVLLTPGLWLIDATVLLGDNVTLNLMAGATLKQMDGANIFPITNKDTTNGNANVWIVGQGLVDGNKENQTSRFSNIALVRSENCGVIGVASRGALRTGTFPNVSRHGEGIELIECVDCYAINTRTYENSYDGIKGRSCNGMVLAYNRHWDNGRAGIQLAFHSDNGEFNGSASEENRADGCLNFRIYGNRVTHPTGASSASAPRTGGIYLHTASDGLIWGNKAEGVAQGVGTIGAVENNRIFGNDLGGFEHSIRLESSGSVGNTIHDNDLYGEGVDGNFVEDLGVDNIVRDNRCRLRGGSGAWGISAQGSGLRVLTNEPDDVPVSDSGSGTEVQRYSSFGGGGGYVPALQTLTDDETISWVLTPGNIAEVTLGGNRTLSNPGELKVGTYPLIVRQDASGGRSLLYGDAFVWPGGTAPALTGTGDYADLLIFECDGANLIGRAHLNYAVAVEVEVITGTELFDGASGGIPADWSADWSTSSVTWSEDAGGFMRAVKTANGRTALRWQVPGDVADVEVLVKLRTDTMPSPGAVAGLVLRGSGSAGNETGYTVRLGAGGGGASDARLERGGYVNGSALSTSMDESFVWSVNTWYWIRARVNGSNIQVRAWEDGFTEPAEWNIDEVDTNISAAGWVGLWGFVPQTADWERISFATDGGDAP